MMTAQNTQPVQTGQVQGGPPTQAMPVSNASILTKKKKKPAEEEHKAPAAPPSTNASILTARRK